MRGIENAALAALALLAGCGSDATATGSSEVRLYVALDQQHSEAMIRRFTADTGIAVRPRFDTEASKTVGLVTAIVEEAAQPRCDVFWNNELAHTVRLAQKGLLQPYASPAAADLPAAYRDPEGRWTGFAARARVLIVNTELVPDPADRPRSMWDLLDPKWRGRCAVARPLTGTTLTHFAALRAVLGAGEFARFVAGLRENEVVLLQSNGATMRETAAGKVAWAFTDTDDYHVAAGKGHPVACVFPDQGPDQIGTMLIPNSVGIVAGAPNPDGARRLVDWLLDARTEALLAAAKSAQIPLRQQVPGPQDPSILRYGSFKAMAWDPAAVAATLDDCVAEFQGRF